jgi:GYF domain 2
MRGGYKVRISDGSEIGPMDLSALQTWLAQGLIDGDSPVKGPGSRNWVPLSSLPELQRTVGASGRSGSRGSKKKKKEAAAARLDTLDDDEVYDAGEPGGGLDRIRILFVGIVLLALAALFAYLAWRPEQALPALDGAPWLQIALGACALGLALLPGWNLARRGVRIVLLLVAFALFPVAGILIAQGERGAALLALASAWFLVSGLFALLSPTLGWAGVALALLPTLAGGYGALRFGLASATGQETPSLRGWATADRRFTDDALGLTLEMPDGWVILKPGNPLVTAPEAARVTFAQPRHGGRGYLLAEPAPRGVSTADQLLDRVLAGGELGHPGFSAGARTNAAVGALSGRRLDAGWSDAGVAQKEVLVAGLDGWMGFALVAWMPEADAARPDGLEPLVGGIAARGILAVNLKKAVDAVVADVPHLSAPAAEQLMAETEARVLDPDQAFRRSLAALAKLLPSLTPAETRELTGLTTATYAGVPWADRSRLADYVERVRRGDSTRAEEDREMMRLMKTAETGLNPTRRLRLQAYYEKAIRALAGG